MIGNPTQRVLLFATLEVGRFARKAGYKVLDLVAYPNSKRETNTPRNISAIVVAGSLPEDVSVLLRLLCRNRLLGGENILRDGSGALRIIYGGSDHTIYQGDSWVSAKQSKVVGQWNGVDKVVPRKGWDAGIVSGGEVFELPNIAAWHVPTVWPAGFDPNKAVEAAKEVEVASKWAPAFA